MVGWVVFFLGGGGGVTLVLSVRCETLTRHTFDSKTPLTSYCFISLFPLLSFFFFLGGGRGERGCCLFLLLGITVTKEEAGGGGGGDY